jgi:hypothetical protein
MRQKGKSTMYKQQTASPERITALRADTERRFQLAELAAAGDLKRLGIQPTGGKLNIYEIDKVMSERKLEPRERIRIKSALAAIGWID